MREISQGSEFVVTVCPWEPFPCTCRTTRMIIGNEQCSVLRPAVSAHQGGGSKFFNAIIVVHIISNHFFGNMPRSTKSSVPTCPYICPLGKKSAVGANLSPPKCEVPYTSTSPEQALARFSNSLYCAKPYFAQHASRFPCMHTKKALGAGFFANRVSPVARSSKADSNSPNGTEDYSIPLG